MFFSCWGAKPGRTGIPASASLQAGPEGPVQADHTSIFLVVKLMFVVVIFFSHVQLLRFVVVKNFQSFSTPKFSHIYLVMWISLSVSPSQEQNHCNILNKLSDIYAHCQKFLLSAITYKMAQAVHVKQLLHPPTPLCSTPHPAPSSLTSGVFCYWIFRAQFKHLIFATQFLWLQVLCRKILDC